MAVDHHQANFVQFPSRRPGAETNDGTLVHGGRQPGISREMANRVLTKQIIKKCLTEILQLRTIGIPIPWFDET